MLIYCTSGTAKGFLRCVRQEPFFFHQQHLLRAARQYPWDKDVKQPPKETNSVPGCDCVNEQDGNSGQLPGCISKIVNNFHTVWSNLLRNINYAAAFPSGCFIAH